MDVAAVVGEEVAEAHHVGVDQVFVEHDLALHLVLGGAATSEDFPVDDLVGEALVRHQLSHLIHLGEAALADEPPAPVRYLPKRKKIPVMMQKKFPRLTEMNS